MKEVFRNRVFQVVWGLGFLCPLFLGENNRLALAIFGLTLPFALPMLIWGIDWRGTMLRTKIRAGWGVATFICLLVGTVWSSTTFSLVAAGLVALAIPMVVLTRDLTARNHAERELAREVASERAAFSQPVDAHSDDRPASFHQHRWHVPRISNGLFWKLFFAAWITISFGPVLLCVTLALLFLIWFAGQFGSDDADWWADQRRQQIQSTSDEMSRQAFANNR
ncbi:hypothetical protein [Paraburkholderia tropica]|uniref:hypothetical protein n=1 Tax=Paraburkholderia tropica TaxID=92647 RepID=UPI002AB5EEED|nr:hypothetical protein [Paraburkholderia tropica]